MKLSHQQQQKLQVFAEFASTLDADQLKQHLISLYEVMLVADSRYQQSLKQHWLAQVPRPDDRDSWLSEAT